MAYTPTVWKNGEFPPIDAEHLNKIEQGIANSAPGGFGYGEYEGFKSWDDNDGSKLESYLDSLLDGTDKIIRFTGLADYPSNILSGNSGWADVAFQNNGVIIVEWCGPTSANAGTVIGVQKAYKKRLIDGTWLPWEYANPPMELGTEYRTTERYLGKPVYCKLIDFGAVPAANANKTVDFAGLDISRIISWTGNVDVGGNTFALPYHEIGRQVNNANIYVFTNYTGITLRTDDQWFAENGGTAQCTIWYTKSTD